MPLLDEIIGWAGGLRPWQQEALRRIFARAELTQDDIETILRMVREQEREDATTGGARPFTLDDVGANRENGKNRTLRFSGQP
jgi:hypothetical protein